MNTRYAIRDNIIFENKLYSCAFLAIALNLLWAVFSDSVLTNLFYPACLVITFYMFCFMTTNANIKTPKDTFKAYFSLIFWFIIMFVVCAFIYSQYQHITFFFFTGDAHAVFFLRLFVSILPCMVFVDNNEFKFDKTVKSLMFIVLLTSVILVMRAVIVHPDAIRARGTMENLGHSDIIKYTPSYAMVYSYAILLPAFLHKTVNTSGKTKQFYFFCVAAISYILIVSQFATALIMGIVGVLIYHFLNVKPQTRAFLFIFYIVMAIILMLTDGGADIFRWLSTKVDGTWAEKLEDIAMTLSGQQDSGSVSGRTTRYELSFKTFLESPLLGKFVKDTGRLGGHSTALDVLGLAGLFGFIPCMYSIYGTYLRMKNHPSFEKNKPAAISCIIVFLIMIFFKNIITSLSVFFAFYVMVPLLLKSEEEVQNEPYKKIGF